MSQQHIMVVIEDERVIEKIEIPPTATGATDWQGARKLEKELKQKYAGRNVHIRDGYLGVSEELFNSTKAFLEQCQSDHPELFEEVFDKERPEFRHLGYKLKKLTKKQIKELRAKNDGANL